MLRSTKFFILTVLAIFVLTACGQSTEEKVQASVESAEEAFLAEEQAHNEEVNGIEFYKPTGFMIDESSDEQNILFNKGKDTFILFLNPNEATDSTLFYNLMVGQEQDSLALETFSKNERFGFVSINKTTEEGIVELVASVGGAKISTRTKMSKMKKTLPEMMRIVRSVK